MKNNTIWGVVIVDIFIISMATTISIWQNNTWYLLLLLLVIAFGDLYEKEEKE